VPRYKVGKGSQDVTLVLGLPDANASRTILCAIGRTGLISADETALAYATVILPALAYVGRTNEK
jgi:hypothetical protein